jgi:hypothetical protein
MNRSSKQNTADHEFVDWLTKTKLLSYREALELEGYEDVISLTYLTDEDIKELSVTIQMKAGLYSLYILFYALAVFQFPLTQGIPDASRSLFKRPETRSREKRMRSRETGKKSKRNAGDKRKRPN